MSNVGPVYNEYQEKVGGAILLTILAEVIGGMVIGYGAYEGGPIYTLAGSLVIGGGALYFSVSVLMTVAAGVDYLKQIADNQAAHVARKRQAAAPSIADNEAAHMQQLGSLIDEPPPAPRPQTRLRKLGRPIDE